MRFSVCVATLGEETKLAPFLGSLNRMKTDFSWELILVLNNAHSPDSEVVGAWQNQAFPVRCLLEPQPGKSRALNLAMDAACGEFLAFTDDDVEVDPGWLQALDNAARDYPQMRVFGGRTLNTGHAPPWIKKSSNLRAALLCEHDLGNATQPYPPNVFPIGSNLTVQARFAKEHELRWPVSIGPGTQLPVGDEFLLLNVLRPQQERRFLYVGNALVHHAGDEKYLRIHAALKRAYQVGYFAGLARHGKGTATITPSTRDAITRVAKLRSIREWLCVSIRALGFLVGSLDKGNKKYLGNPE